MATQGLISVVDGDEVLMKIVAGCDGYNAWKLAKRIWGMGFSLLPDVDTVMKWAWECDFGCPLCLVVQTRHSDTYPKERVALPSSDTRTRYAQHFSEPRFNPRREDGTPPAHTIVLDISKKKPELDYSKLSAKQRVRLSHSWRLNREWTDAWGVSNWEEEFLHREGWLERHTRPGGFGYWYQYRPTQRALRVLRHIFREAEKNA